MYVLKVKILSVISILFFCAVPCLSSKAPTLETDRIKVEFRKDLMGLFLFR
jgi:hypothetical protein